MSVRNLSQSSARQLLASEVATLAVLTKDAYGSSSDSKTKTRLALKAVEELRQRAPQLVEVDQALSSTAAILTNGTTLPAVHLSLLRSEEQLADVLQDDEKLRVCIDVITSTRWSTKEVKLKLGASGLSEALLSLDERMDAETVGAIQKGHRKQLSKLMKGSVARSTKLFVLAGSVLVSVFTVGTAAPVIGSFIGATFLGLSGAAATSAGLALLGGGSLASGGLGMAGGILLVKLGAGGMYKGASRAAIQIARSSRTAFIAQLATLHVYLRLAPATVEEIRDTLAELNDLRTDLLQERDRLRRVGVDSAGRLDAQEPDSEPTGRALRRVEGCLRALDAEIMDLRGHRSKVGWVTRVPWGQAKDVYDLITH